jgi:hypothetical protein
LLAVGLAACSDDVAVESHCEPPVGACDSSVCAPDLRDGVHVELCSHIDFETNPPTSGPHYPLWADFAVYDNPVPRGLYLHSMEHGAVVLAYNCALASGDCQTLVDALVALREGFGQDQDCVAPTLNRIVVTPDPQLDVAFAAAAWGHSLRASCVDEALTRGFIEQSYGQAPEDFCTAGVDPDASPEISAGCGD